MEQLGHQYSAFGLLNIPWWDADVYNTSSSEYTSSLGYTSTLVNVNSSVPSKDPGFFGCQTSWGPLSPVYSDIAPCFQAALIVASSAAYIVVGAHEIIRLRHQKPAPNRTAWSFYAKIAIGTFHVILQAILLANSPKGISSSALTFNTLAAIIALTITYLDQLKSSIPNGATLFFWLGQVTFHVMRVVSTSLRDELGTTSGISGAMALATSVFSLLLSAGLPPRAKGRIPAESPRDKANVFSRITFAWMGPLMRKGYMQYLKQHDLPLLPRALRAQATRTQFTQEWKRHVHPSLVKSLARAFGFLFAVGGVFKGMQDVLGFVQPQLLKMLINFVNEYLDARARDEPIALTKGLMIAAAMFFVSVTQTACLHQYFERAFDLGMKLKSALTAVVYNKALVLLNEARGASNTGDIVNLMSVDVQRLQDLVQNLQVAWSGPFQIAICLYLLHGLIGNAMWAGVFIMVVMIPLNGVIARVQKRLQKTQMGYKDARLRLISEILGNIKLLKLYAWEPAYLARLREVRNDQELANLKRMGVWLAFLTSTWNLAPFLVSCSTFALFVLTQKRALSTDIVFPALALFNLLLFPLAVVPSVITSVVEAQVAVSRLTKFLTAGELQSDAVVHAPRAAKRGDTAVHVANGTFLWSRAEGDSGYKVALSRISLHVRKGEMHCIVGRVGLGKSLVVQAILGDLYRLDGLVTVHGRVAYVSQVAWIMNGSVRENVLFGKKYDAGFYAHVLKACALDVDLRALPAGDATEVGEKGIALSGGQKARLALARAVYARADVYLLDDPLSAVDEHVGRHLVEHVIGPRGMLRDKAIVLATNNIKVLRLAQMVHLVGEGRMLEQCAPSEMREGLRLWRLVEEYAPRKKEEEKKEVDEAELSSESEFEVESGTPSDEEIDGDEQVQEGDEEAGSNTPVPEDARAEHMEQGQVKWGVYRAYAVACGVFSTVVFLSCTVLSNVIVVLSNVWLKHWSEVNTEHGYNPQIPKYLGIYFLLGIGYLCATLLQVSFMWVYCTINGLAKLHESMAVSVLRAPMSFFETTPIGRILNRFSNDVYKVDEVLGRVFGMFFMNLTKVLFTILVITFLTWQFIFVMLPLSVLYVYYQQYYMRTLRELRRLDLVSRSPIYANFQESLTGVLLIRAFGQELRFRAMNELRIDRNMAAFHPAINANRWLAVRLEFLGSIIILAAAGISILSLRSGRLSAGLVGLSVLYSLQITQSLNWIVRMTVEVETNIVSVERILEYSELTPEAPAVIELRRPVPDWPQHGEIEFKDYSARYRPELDLVLKGINLDVKPREKIGIVGRTGAGKSSVTLALFRIIEAAGGEIDIDGVRTSGIGLADLRHRLLIIPQDSQVLEGTIRSNLDPTGEYSDADVWRALELCHLKAHVTKMHAAQGGEGDALDAAVHESGSNLSIGQRQLMCLGRVLLKLSHGLNVLVLDEATAAVDVETDKILQETIRREFKDKTIITIAHRLNTIMDSDRIVVLEKGEVAEFDRPAALLEKDGLFHALAKEGGFTEN